MELLIKKAKGSLIERIADHAAIKTNIGTAAFYSNTISGSITFTFACYYSVILILPDDFNIKIGLYSCLVFIFNTFIHMLHAGAFSFLGIAGFGKIIPYVNKKIIRGKIEQDLQYEEYQSLLRKLSIVPLSHAKIGIFWLLHSLAWFLILIRIYNPELVNLTLLYETAILFLIALTMHPFLIFFIAEIIIGKWVAELKRIMHQKKIAFEDKAIFKIKHKFTALFIIFVIILYISNVLAYNIEKKLNIYFLITFYIFIVLCYSIIIYLIYKSITVPFQQLEHSVISIIEDRPSYLFSRTQDKEIITVSNGVNYAIDSIIKYKKNKENYIHKLQKLDSLKDEFLANTSHELSTPLNGIIGLAESLFDGSVGSIDEQIKSNLFMIIVSGKRLKNLVNDILDLSRLKNNDLTIQIKPCDIKVISRMVLDLCQHTIKGKNIKLRDTIQNNIPLLAADEDRLQQIMYNLIGNAIKFTSEGNIIVGAKTLTDMVEVSVADDGIGIPLKNQARVFEYFEQVDGGSAREYGGTGIGLAITKKLLELQGGQIGFTSKPGLGSTFYFTLPISHKTPEKPDIQPYKQPLAQTVPDNLNLTIDAPIKSTIDKIYRILVVDDDPINIQVIRNFLEAQDYEVIHAYNGYEALNTLSGRDELDLIILDIMMPKISGYEVANLIREKYKISELPILMLTAKNQISDLVLGFEAGANDYLIKPFDKSELLARVNTLLTLKTVIAEQKQYISLKKGFEIAGKVQKSIIPQDLPDIPGVDISVSFLPMEYIAGDYYDFHCFRESKIGFFLADGSGHGMPASLIASMTKIIFSNQRGFAALPSEMMANLNNALKNELEEHYFSAAYFFIDREKMRLSYASAGHHPLLLFRQKNQQIIPLKPEGGLIGIYENGSYCCQEIDIEIGDRIVLYSDGISKAKNQFNELFSDKRLAALIQNHANLKTAQFNNFVINALEKWSVRDQRQFDDDITMIVVDIVHPQK